MKELVSVVISTKSEEKNIGACLQSLLKQTYSNIEIVLVDNNSRDRTIEIAKKYISAIYSKGPERSAQRNYGFKKSRGKIILFIDADMTLEQNVVDECVRIIKSQHLGSVVIPEKSIGTSFWAKCKALEKKLYLGIEWMEASRCFTREALEKVGAYDELLVSGEDWDLSQRVKHDFRQGRVASMIVHHEGNLSLLKTIQKKYYYSKKFKAYTQKSENRGEINSQTSILSRYGLFLSQPRKLFEDPLLGVGLLFMKTCEFAAGGLGYLFAK